MTKKSYNFVECMATSTSYGSAGDSKNKTNNSPETSSGDYDKFVNIKSS